MVFTSVGVALLILTIKEVICAHEYDGRLPKDILTAYYSPVPGGYCLTHCVYEVIIIIEIFDFNHFSPIIFLFNASKTLSGLTSVHCQSSLYLHLKNAKNTSNVVVGEIKLQQVLLCSGVYMLF